MDFILTDKARSWSRQGGIHIAALRGRPSPFKWHEKTGESNYEEIIISLPACEEQQFRVTERISRSSVVSFGPLHRWARWKRSDQNSPGRCGRGSTGLGGVALGCSLRCPPTNEALARLLAFQPLSQQSGFVLPEPEPRDSCRNRMLVTETE